MTKNADFRHPDGYEMQLRRDVTSPLVTGFVAQRREISIPQLARQHGAVRVGVALAQPYDYSAQGAKEPQDVPVTSK